MDLNQRPTGYEPAALTTELRALMLEGDMGVFPSKGIDRGQLACVNPASLKEQGAVEARVSRGAYIVCETTSGDHSVVLVSERDCLDGGCDCFEVLASHVEPSLIGYVYIISALRVGVKGKMHLFSLFFLSPYKGNLN